MSVSISKIKLPSSVAFRFLLNNSFSSYFKQAMFSSWKSFPSIYRRQANWKKNSLTPHPYFAGIVGNLPAYPVTIVSNNEDITFLSFLLCWSSVMSSWPVSQLHKQNRLASFVNGYEFSKIFQKIISENNILSILDQSEAFFFFFFRNILSKQAPAIGYLNLNPWSQKYVISIREIFPA